MIVHLLIVLGIAKVTSVVILATSVLRNNRRKSIKKKKDKVAK